MSAHRGPERRHRAWSLRSRLTLAFTVVALAAVFLTSRLILSAAVRAQQDVTTYYLERPPRVTLRPGEPPVLRVAPRPGWPGWDDPTVQPARDAIRDLGGRAFLAALLAAVLAGAAAVLVTRRITAPLSALADAARRLSGGERGLRVRVPRADGEVRDVAEAFNNLSLALERQESWRRRMVADVAHDLRTPLAVMRGEIEAMQDGVVPMDRAGLDRLHAEVLLLARLIGDLRTLSLAEGGGLSLRREPARVAPLLRRLIESFASRAAASGVTLELERVDPALEAVIDVDRVTQVLHNLLDNALRHAGPGAVTVGAARDGATVRVWVRDRGPGLGADASRVFERFYRGDEARTRGVAGSGLGLAIARALAEAHGGRLEAANHPAGGAVFTLVLPRDAARPDAADAVATGA